MKKDNLDNLFERLQGSFDSEEPKTGHEVRFLEKLDASRKSHAATPLEFVYADRKRKNWWKPFAVAASFTLFCLVTVGLLQTQPTTGQQIAEISPEVSRTQHYFAGLIEQQVSELESENNPQTRQVISDAMAQLAALESDFIGLEKDLIDGGNSKLILSAMITNFRTRIDLLQEVSNEIETIKKINATDDTTTTI